MKTIDAGYGEQFVVENKEDIITMVNDMYGVLSNEVITNKYKFSSIVAKPLNAILPLLCNGSKNIEEACFNIITNMSFIYLMEYDIRSNQAICEIITKYALNINKEHLKEQIKISSDKIQNTENFSNDNGFRIKPSNRTKEQNGAIADEALKQSKMCSVINHTFGNRTIDIHMYYYARHEILEFYGQQENKFWITEN